MTKDKQGCHLCQNDETIPHLFQCQHRNIWRTQFQQKLTNQLQKLKTTQAIQTNIEQLFTNILTNPQQYQQFHTFTVFAGLPPLKWRQDHQTMNTHYVANRWGV